MKTKSNIIDHNHIAASESFGCSPILLISSGTDKRLALGYSG
ncbi:MAG TPA: hypothetical protein VEV83_14575 [Parafilimonas sp.]|nr:hypothetical protein [Parafilimonas sp.]